MVSVLPFSVFHLPKLSFIGSTLFTWSVVPGDIFLSVLIREMMPSATSFDEMPDARSFAPHSMNRSEGLPLQA